MGRAPCCDKANVKKGPWSPEEDAKLKFFIQTNGTGGNWITLPSKAGLRRCGKSCRLRWINYLRPDIKHGSFTEEEEKVIIDLHGKLGSRWSLIAARLPGRTDNDIKNYWNTRLKKKLAEKGINPSSSHHHHQLLHHHQQQEQQRYDMPRSSGETLFRVSMLKSGEFSQPQMRKEQLIDHGTAQLWEQPRYNVAQMPIPQSRPATSLFTQRQHLEQWQQGSAIYPTVKGELPPHASDTDQRMRKIQSELLDMISPEGSDAVTSTQTSDILHQLSPNSPCSNWSPDMSYGGHLDDSSYGDGLISYGDPPPLVDVQSHPLLPMTSVPSPLSHKQQLPTSVRSMQTENSAPATPSTSSGRYGGSYGEFQGLFVTDQTSFLSDSVTSSLDKILGGKEEGSSDFSSSDFMPDLISSPTTRGFLSTTKAWPQRCGDGLPSANQAQLLPSQTLDAFSEQLGFKYPNQNSVHI